MFYISEICVDSRYLGENRTYSVTFKDDITSDFFHILLSSHELENMKISISKSYKRIKLTGDIYVERFKISQECISINEPLTSSGDREGASHINVIPTFTKTAQGLCIINGVSNNLELAEVRLQNFDIANIDINKYHLLTIYNQRFTILQLEES